MDSGVSPTSTLTISGTYQQQVNGSLQVTVSSTTPSTPTCDRVQVTGAATLNGTLAIDLVNGAPEGIATCTIMDYASRTGIFSSETGGVPPVYFYLTYQASSITLTVYID